MYKQSWDRTIGNTFSKQIQTIIGEGTPKSTMKNLTTVTKSPWLIVPTYLRREFTRQSHINTKKMAIIFI